MGGAIDIYQWSRWRYAPKGAEIYEFQPHLFNFPQFSICSENMRLLTVALASCEHDGPAIETDWENEA